MDMLGSKNSRALRSVTLQHGFVGWVDWSSSAVDYPCEARRGGAASVLEKRLIFWPVPLMHGEGGVRAANRGQRATGSRPATSEGSMRSILSETARFPCGMSEGP